MQDGILIADNLYWVGMNDRRTHLFESIWPIPRGVSYNSYLILDEKTVLIDGVKDISVGGYLDKLRNRLGPNRTIDYLVVNHLEPDHSGAIPVLRKTFPGIKIIGNKKTAEFLSHIYDVGGDLHLVDDGDELNLGRRTLRFYMTPMVHWPETMMTYVPGEGILFAGDAFGGFGALEGGIFDDEVDIHYFEDEILRYFSNIVGKFSPMVQRAIAKLGGLDIKTIASTHGPIWRSNPEHIVKLYDKWSRHEAEPGVVLAYASMYGNTERMAEAVARGLSEAGVTTIRTHDVSTSHVSYVVRDIWRYGGLILGSPTYDNGVFPAMQPLLHLLSAKRLTNRTVGVFGSYGWSGGAVKGLKEFAETCKLNLIEPVVESRFSGTEEHIEQCRVLGANVAKALGFGS